MFENPHELIKTKNTPRSTQTTELSSDEVQEPQNIEKDGLNNESEVASEFGFDPRMATNFLESRDVEILNIIHDLVSEEMFNFNFDEAEVYLSKYYIDLSLHGKLFLLERSINYLSNNEFDDGSTDMQTISSAVLKFSKEDNANFFVNNFAESFLEEDDFSESLEKNPREYIKSIWSNCILHKDDTTIFRGSFNDVLIPRNIASVAEFTEDEVEKIIELIQSEHKIEGHDKMSNAYEWVSKNENKEFENKQMSQKMILNENLRVCNLSSDVNGVYDSTTGQLVEYLQNQPNLPDEESDIDLLTFRQDYIDTINILEDIGGMLAFKGEMLSDVPSSVISALPQDIADRIKDFLNESMYLRNSSEYVADEYGRVQMKDWGVLSDIKAKADGLKADIQQAVDNFLKEKEVIVEPLHINELIHTENHGDNNRLEYIHKLFASKRMRQHMEKYFGFKYEELTLKTQVMFIQYVIDKDSVEVDEVKQFISAADTEKEKIDRFRTFLSLEQGGETLGDDIVTFGKNFEGAEKVFSYYSELLDSADKAEELVRKVSSCDGEECIKMANQVRDNILKRAQRDLETAVQTNDVSEVESQIENYLVEAKEYVAVLQEIDAGNIENINSDELTLADQDKLLVLLQTNYDSTYPEPEDRVFKEAVYYSLKKNFSNPDNTFKILRDGEKIVSFNRFESKVDSTGTEITYFGSFNADPAYSGAGSVMLEKTIEEELQKGNPIQAHTDPAQSITKKYINGGFVVTNIEDNYAGTGRMIFEIWQSPDINSQLESKSMSDEQLLEMTENSHSSITVREQTESDTYPEITSGQALTRYITQNNKTYLVFEKIPETTESHINHSTEDLREAA
jgi:hypothetical protein